MVARMSGAPLHKAWISSQPCRRARDMRDRCPAYRCAGPASPVLLAHAGFCNGPRRVKRLMGWDHPDSADSDTISLQRRLPCLPSKPLAKRAII